jgi:hypothetical protein
MHGQPNVKFKKNKSLTCYQRNLQGGRRHDCSDRQNKSFRSCTPNYRGADKSLARPGMKQATTTEDF